MTETDYNEFKKQYLSFFTDTTIRSGGLQPHITLFGETYKDDILYPAIVIDMIDSKYLDSEEGKDLLISERIPKLAKRTKEDKIEVFAIAWASEAWIRVLEKGQSMPKDYKELPISKEVIVLCIDSIIKKEVIVYEITRTGHQVTNEGKLVDKIELSKIEVAGINEQAEGRFHNLLKVFLDAQKS